MLTRLTTIATACLTLAACGGGGDHGFDAASGQDRHGATGAGPSGREGATAEAAPAPPADTDPAGELLVRLHRTADLPGVLATHGLTRIDASGARPIYRLAVPADVAMAPLLNALRADPRVRLAEPNRSAGMPEARRRSVWAIGEASAYTAQWAPAAIGLPAAPHDDDRQRRAGGDPRHRGRRVASGAGGSTAAGPRLRRRGFRSGRGRQPGTTRGHGHGTHVAGLVALSAPGAMLMPLRVLDAQGRGNVWVIGEALLHAVDPDGLPSTPDGAQVINLSLGTTEPTDLLRELIDIVGCRSDDDDDDNGDDEDDDTLDDDAVRCAVQGGAVVIAAAGQRRQRPPAAVPGGRRRLRLARGRREHGREPAGGLQQSGRVGADRRAGRRHHQRRARWWLGRVERHVDEHAAGRRGWLRCCEAGIPTGSPRDITQQLAARAARLCDGPWRQLDAGAAVQDLTPEEPRCP